jgi:hypothetical protein
MSLAEASFTWHSFLKVRARSLDPGRRADFEQDVGELEVTWEIHRLTSQRYEVRVPNGSPNIWDSEFGPAVTGEFLRPEHADRYLTVGFAWIITVPPTASVAAGNQWASSFSTTITGTGQIQAAPEGVGGSLSGGGSVTNGSTHTRVDTLTRQNALTGGKTVVRYYRFEAGHHRSLTDRWVTRRAHGVRVNFENVPCHAEYYLDSERLYVHVGRPYQPRPRRRSAPPNCACQ